MMVRVHKYEPAATLGMDDDQVPVGIVVPEVLAWYVTADDFTPFPVAPVAPLTRLHVYLEASVESADMKSVY